MATRTYYGTCKTGRAEVEKRVYVPDTDLEDSNFNFEEGDLLVVFFAQTNTVNAPSIVIYNQDPEIETSTTDDLGHYIKSLDVEANMENAWAAGETVIFAYTQQDTAGPYYWELVDGAHATTETYGSTKLEGDEDKPYLSWQLDSQIEQSEQTTGTLGTLSLNNGTASVSIPYVLPPTPETITHTGQLFNNGNGTKPNNLTDENTEPFITRVVPNNLYFGIGHGLSYGTVGGISEGTGNANRIILNDNTNDLAITSSRYIKLQKPTYITGNTTIAGALSATVDSTSKPGITTNGIIQEKNTPLTQRYSPLLKVFKFSVSTGTIKPGKSFSHNETNVAKTNWTPLCVVGYNLNYVNKNSTDDPKFANVWECYLKLDSNGNPTTTVETSVYNISTTQTIQVELVFFVLYQKNL